MTVSRGRFAALSDHIRAFGLAGGKVQRIGARVNPELLRIATEATGVASDSAVLELALGNLVMEEGFPDAAKQARGQVAADVDLGLDWRRRCEYQGSSVAHAGGAPGSIAGDPG